MNQTNSLSITNSRLLFNNFIFRDIALSVQLSLLQNWSYLISNLKLDVEDGLLTPKKKFFKTQVELILILFWILNISQNLTYLSTEKFT